MYVQSALSGICDLPTSFQTELAINTNMMVADMHRNAVTGREGPPGRNDLVGETALH